MAKSLGDEIAEVTGQVQVLHRKGIIREQNNFLQINSIYYPQLKEKLLSNNFIISGE